MSGALDGGVIVVGLDRYDGGIVFERPGERRIVLRAEGRLVHLHRDIEELVVPGGEAGHPIYCVRRRRLLRARQVYANAQQQRR